jgi:predicted HTH transcriptional regulator
MFIINKRLSDIVFSDIEGLISNQVAEGKSIDYKLTTYGGKDDDKKELVKDVSSFANSAGGDIIIGVEEKQSIPIKIIGISIDIDKEILRLENIISTSIAPRIPNIEIHPIQINDGNYVLIIRVPKSWQLPIW